MGYPKVDDEYDGRYRIVRRIGHGGMGVVYEAVDKVLNRSVALKIVLPSLPDREDFHARFAREASVLARIRSRNIVGIHEYGETDDTVYFVTELFPDGDLRTWLQTHGPLDRRASLSLVAQTCEALADAHAAGVIHRDVKPGNVLLWHRPEGLIPYLADFGIALDGNASEQEGLTRAGTLVGSPAYMAPERHFGHAADERGDVYSMGCLLWAVLTGDAPYAGTDFQMINSHVNSPIPQLRTGHPVDDRIDELLARTLHKDPEQRVQSAGDLREALLAIIRDIDSGRLPPPGPVTGADDPVEAAAPATPPLAAPTAEPEPEDDRTVIKPAAGVLGGAAAAAAAAAAAREAHDEPQADSTVARKLVTPAPVAAAGAGHGADGSSGGSHDGPVDGPQDGPTGPAPGPRDRRRRGGLAALAAAGLVAVVAVAAVAVNASTGDDEPSAGDPTPTGSATTGATDPASPSDSASPSASADAPAAPEAPRVEARGGYRSVSFRIREATEPGGDVVQTTEYDVRGAGWQSLGDTRFTVDTDQGGERVCVRVRTVAESAAGGTSTSEVQRDCASSDARVVRLVRTPGPCTTTAQGFTYPCAWYGVEVAGFTSGTRPVPRLTSAQVGEWCEQGVDCVPIPVGQDGRGRVPRLAKVARDEGVVTLVVDGVRVRARVAYP
ncbi:serine/threonine-protein kinase [Nocardioides sp. SOB77]|uniref:non-specific serine/threonine protein kinase n=1 Tax=Nocardioides oceani TaxID=3058369 RepID=A0ABT8FGR1_9ACTN|nr:serine/threonine-protein kinase [Nocardioides oceani]MDN4173724.1 serine/threonine-protein kinase [Nocardioides oceani]